MKEFDVHDRSRRSVSLCEPDGGSVSRGHNLVFGGVELNEAECADRRVSDERAVSGVNL
jgi:hypothetical protein